MDVYNPLNPYAVPALLPSGQALATRDTSRTTISLAATTTRIAVFVTNCGYSSTVAATVTLFNTGTPTVVVGTHDVPKLILAAGSGGPTSGRAMKYGVSLVNTSKWMDMNGIVRVLTTDQRIAFPTDFASMTNAQWNASLDAIAAHPHCRVHNGPDFVHPKMFIGHPVDSTAYNAFDHWEGPMGAADFFDLISVHPVDLRDRRRPMSTTVLIFEPASVANLYSISIHGSWYTRWPLDTLLGTQMTTVATAAVSNLARADAHAIRTAADPRSGIQ